MAILLVETIISEELPVSYINGSPRILDNLYSDELERIARFLITLCRLLEMPRSEFSIFKKKALKFVV